MLLFNQLIIACWIVFLLVWMISATQAKRTIGRRFVYSWASLAVRLGLLLIILAALHWNIVHLPTVSMIPTNATQGTIGVILCAAGIAFAVWARFNLGRNWGMPMTLKENRELVTSGPYVFVRHPIYTGMLLAILGSAMVVGSLWYLIWIITAVGFTISAKKEEQMLTKEFPDTYPAYKARTKMIIPWIY